VPNQTGPTRSTRLASRPSVTCDLRAHLHQPSALKITTWAKSEEHRRLTFRPFSPPANWSWLVLSHISRRTGLVVRRGTGQARRRIRRPGVYGLGKNSVSIGGRTWALRPEESFPEGASFTVRALDLADRILQSPCSRPTASKPLPISARFRARANPAFTGDALATRFHVRARLCCDCPAGGCDGLARIRPTGAGSTRAFRFPRLGDYMQTPSLRIGARRAVRSRQKRVAIMCAEGCAVAMIAAGGRC